jgi:hypothetical protein
MYLKLAYLLCFLGLHRYKIINIDFSFGKAGNIMKVQCKICGYIKIKKGG